MIQYIIVFIFIAAALGNVISGLRKIWLKRKITSATCGGCGNCSLKRNFAHHAHG